MSTWSSPAFTNNLAKAYAAHRPIYTKALYRTILDYYSPFPTTDRASTAYDVGCGTGQVARALSRSFGKVVGMDPSPKMVEEARKIQLTAGGYGGNVTYARASAEEIGKVVVPGGSADLITAAQAAHWFDHATFFAQAWGGLRVGGTLAIWGYGDLVVPGYVGATRVLRGYAYGEEWLGPCWEQPGRRILTELYRSVNIPADGWEDVRRLYGRAGGGARAGEKVLEEPLVEPVKFGMEDLRNYLNTWSSVQTWRENQKEVLHQGGVDVVDTILEGVEEEMRREGWDGDEKYEVEWPTVLILARKAEGNSGAGSDGET